MLAAQRLGSLSILDSSMTANSAGSDGGAVSVATLLLSSVFNGSTLDGNAALAGGGGVLNIHIPEPVRMHMPVGLQPVAHTVCTDQYQDTTMVTWQGVLPCFPTAYCCRAHPCWT